MTRFAIACCLLLVSVPAFAQSRGSKDPTRPDVLTGAWAGELVASDRHVPVTLQLKFDGTRAVTGTISGLPNPGDVKRGTFDPKTGALMLELGRSDGAAVLITLEGTVAKNTATGKVNGEPGEGTFTLRRKP